jgi:cell fate (sporulation/competence/biofilm development) regulator YlbF (YheA/YmcA/DUF963 family)
MNKSEELMALLENNELVVQTKALRTVILNNPVYFECFQTLIHWQKTMVQKDQSGNKASYETAKNEYLRQMQALISFPAVAEYLNCSEELSALFKEVTEILSRAGKTSFD